MEILAIIVILAVLFLATVFAFPEFYLELLKRYMKKSGEDYAREFGYKKMIKDLGPPEPWEYPFELDEETMKR